MGVPRMLWGEWVSSCAKISLKGSTWDHKWTHPVIPTKASNGIKVIYHDHALMQKQTPTKKVIFAPTIYVMCVHLPRGIIQLNYNVLKWLDRFTLWRRSRFIWCVTWRWDIKEVRFALVFGLFCLRRFINHERSRSFSLKVNYV